MSNNSNESIKINDLLDTLSLGDNPSFPKDKIDIPLFLALYTYAFLNGKNIVTQVLGGFNEALLMQRLDLQLPIADPGDPENQAWTQTIREKVAGEGTTAPITDHPFLPIRSGSLKINRLHIIDTFGQIHADIHPNGFITPETLTPATGNGDSRLLLPPRMVQPVRLNFRWLSATGDREMNEHPSTSPVCGWLMPNRLDNGLWVYDREGRLLGQINRKGDWLPPPGTNLPPDPEMIPQLQLKQIVQKLQSGPEFLEDMIKTLDKALETIDPVYSAYHEDLACITGRPIAIVRARLGLTLKGEAAVDHSGEALAGDMESDTRTTHDFEEVKFPVRLGDHSQYNDGIVGYWTEVEDGSLEQDFYTPLTPTEMENESLSSGKIKLYEATQPALTMAVADPERTLTLLMDPRGKAHAVTGFLPIKAIEIPPDQYAQALKNMELTFTARPLLTPRNSLNIPLPNEAGYVWSYLFKERFNWQEVSTLGTIDKTLILNAFPDGEALWQALQEQGWITEVDSQKASIVPKGQRPGKPLSDLLQQYSDALEALLSKGYLQPVSATADFAGGSEIREGWLKLRWNEE